MADQLGCARVTAVVGDDAPTSPEQSDDSRKEIHVTATVGQKAPDFTAPAFRKGGFESVALSDYLGKWVLLCFYPGDFTFV
jgi:hypothetical protein